MLSAPHATTERANGHSLCGVGKILSDRPIPDLLGSLDAELCTGLAANEDSVDPGVREPHPLQGCG